MKGGRMKSVELNIEGMACEHCVKAVTNAINSYAGVSDVNVSLSQNKATFSYDPEAASLEDIKQSIVEEGYEVK
jgi:copper chaperone